ncbi:MAG: T9SS type A sorting domain-containing protein [Bacteroidia bacterium]|nr:T9SS type A sorting domain-containing protein [Bacteroidia bacterium]
MKRFLHLIILCLLNGMFYANTKPAIGFIENKGQIHDQNFKPNTEVKFLLSIPGMNIQLKQNSFSYDTYTVEQKSTETNRETVLTKLKHPKLESTYHFHRVDVEFIGANTQPEIIAEQPSETYYNYYTTGVSEQGATNVRSYEKVTYKNIYPNIDLEFIAIEGKLKYNFIVHNGGNMNVIKWKYHGANTTEIKNNNISIAVKQGEFNEAIPESYLRSNSKKGKQIKIDFIKDANGVYGFDSKQNFKLMANQEIVIDPILNLLWATYFGGTQSDVIWNTCLDSFNNIYSVGWSDSPSFIATTGSYQNTFAGIYDAFISKFNTNGNLLWATYFGGNDDDSGYGICLDKVSNFLYISGITSSTNNIATLGSQQQNYGGGPCDGFLAKFTTSGVLIWSTYYGGTGNDQGLDCKIDNLGNVYLVGSTSSTLGISTTGAFQTIYAGGLRDGFISKYNTNGNILWSTYYGGSGDEIIETLEFNSKNRLFVGGETNSSTISTPISHQPGYSGSGYDAFLSSFNITGQRVWSTYYGGSGREYLLDVKCDSLDNVFICGSTNSIDSIASIGTFQTSMGGSGLANQGDGYLVNFDTNGVRKWGTYFGGGNDDCGYAIATVGSAIYLTGVTQSLNQIATTNAYQTVLSSPYADMFITKFDKLGLRVWGSYIGGFTNDIAYNVCLNTLGEIVITGTSDGWSAFPTTSGSYQPNLKGSTDGVVLKLRENSVSGISESILLGSKISIYPNPNSGSFTIQTKEDVVLEIVNELGQVVRNIKLDASNNHQTNITGLADGVYCLKDKLSGTIIKNKIVVVR